MPPTLRWVIGDIHGMLKPLGTLISAVEAHDHECVFYFVGDYVNRGPDSRGVIDLLLNLPDDRAKMIRGNHDDIFDLILNGKSFAAGNEPVPVFAWFMAHGLGQTLMSYGIDEADIEHVQRKPSPNRLKELVEGVPDRHRLFFRHLPLMIEEKDIFLIHAKWRGEDSDSSPDIAAPVAQSSRLKHRALWERFSDEEISRTKSWHRRGFFGHTPVINYSLSRQSPGRPIVTHNQVLLDTGVALSTEGRLTAYCVETDQYAQTDHYGGLVPPDM
jgi:serine/threonine protein phosphatase 1